MKRIIYVAVLCSLSVWTLASFVHSSTEVKAEKEAPWAGKFGMLTMNLSDKAWLFIKYNSATGEAWQVSGTGMEKCAEAAPIPAGDYEFQMVITSGTKVVTRVEKNSGRIWYFGGDKFVEMTEIKK